MTTGKDASGPFRIGLFGQIRVLAGEEVIARLPPGKRGVLLGFLAVHHDRGHVREELIERFWPEVEPVAGHNRLKQTLSELRRSLTEQHQACGALLAADRQRIALNADRVAGTDVADFEAALRSAALARSGPDRIARLAGAVKLYRGDLIAGSYDDWVLGERERLAHAYAEALVQIVDALERIGEPERALHYARLAVQADPWREEAHRAILRTLGALGRRPEVLRHYLEMERLFLRELGARPSAEATALFEMAKREQSSGTLRGSGRAAGVTAAAATTTPPSRSGEPCRWSPDTTSSGPPTRRSPPPSRGRTASSS
jgi:DNA-binding SARP family transcriptional activator